MVNRVTLILAQRLKIEEPEIAGPENTTLIMVAALPPNEKARLAALHDLRILDTPGEDAYDDITRLAAYICGTPIAAVTLVDADRQWFKSILGLDSSETTREVAFCAHTILDAGLTIVSDATLDARFANNPLVTGDPRIRFYAGAPLISEDGYALGSLCVIDRVARHLSPEQEAALRTLARQVIAQLEMKRQVGERDRLIAERAKTQAALQISQDRMAEAQRIAHIGSWALDLRTGERSWSSELFRITGLDPSQGPPDASHLRALYHPDDREQYDDALAAMLATGKQSEMDIRGLRPNGEVRWLRVTAAAVRDENGTIVQAIGTAADITERKAAEERLRQSRDELAQQSHIFDTTLSTISDFAYIVDPDARFIFANRAMLEHLGLTSASIVGKTFSDFQIAPERASTVQKQIHQVITTKCSLKDETTARNVAGQLRQFEYVYSPVLTVEGDVQAVVGSAHDITERKQAEEALKESEERFRQAYEHSAIGIALVGIDTSWIRANPALCRLLGYTDAEFLTMSVASITHPDDLEPNLRLIRRLVNGEIDHYQMEKRYYHKNGAVIWAELTAALVRNAEQEPLYFVSQIQDISQRKTAEAALRASEKRLQAAERVAHSGSWEFDPESGAIHWSEGMFEVMRLDPAAGVPNAEARRNLFHPEDLPRFEDAMRRTLHQGVPFELDLRIVLADGSIRWLQAAGSVTDSSDGRRPLLGTLQDVTERYRLQRHVIESDKMAALGKVAAGVAHEVNNPLAAISGIAQLLASHSDPDVKADAQTVRDMADRATRVVRALKDFARQAPGGDGGLANVRRRAASLNTIAQDAALILQYPISTADITFETHFAEDLPLALVDAPQVERLIINLISNAIQAVEHIPRREEGRQRSIVIRTAALPGRVRLTISDNGKGISADVLPHIFTPFFTTKDAGAGLGIGLAICQSITAAHLGTLDVVSSPEQGTTFTVELPSMVSASEATE